MMSESRPSASDYEIFSDLLADYGLVIEISRGPEGWHAEAWGAFGEETLTNIRRKLRNKERSGVEFEEDEDRVMLCFEADTKADLERKVMEIFDEGERALCIYILSDLREMSD